MQDIVANKEQIIAKTVDKIGECHNVIQDQKYTLNKLDAELGYYESQNEQHKNAQAQLFKANEYEYVQGKDGQLKYTELDVLHQKLEQDE